MGLVTDLYWHLGAWTAMVMACLMILAFFPPRRLVMIAIAVAFASVLALIPLFELSVHHYVASATGPLSGGFFTLVFFCLWALFVQRPVVGAHDEVLFVGWVSVVGSVLYASTFNFFGFDVYAFGFDRWAATLFAAVVLMLALFTRSVMLSSWVAVSSAVWLCGLTGSKNLWDAFIDPIAWIAAICILISHLAAKAGRPIPYFGLRMCSRPFRDPEHDNA